MNSKMIIHGEGEALVSPCAACAQVEAIQQLTANNQCYQQLCAAVQRHYEIHFRREQYVKTMLTLFAATSASALST